jgi:hypothetical protein
MPNRTEARPAKAALTNATGRLPLLRLFSTPLKTPRIGWVEQNWGAGEGGTRFYANVPLTFACTSWPLAGLRYRIVLSRSE